MLSVLLMGIADGIADSILGDTVTCTSRATRSRASGENLFDLVMAPFSQIVELPRSPGRFSLSTGTIHQAAKAVGAAAYFVLDSDQAI